ncbi:MAG: DUF4125 family protein [Deltaproteobacteria bacterium]|nr:DUF4125 family protein [Deltaproteobacteria bacterium]
MEETINAVIDREWEFMRAVRNFGGRAACQDDFTTFSRMRKSQFMAWPAPALAGYLEDLKEAGEAGRNLLAEKYARMMAFTHPEEYLEARDFLPALSAETLALVREIAQIHLEWQREYARAYPALAARSRSVENAWDAEDNTSFETYLQGELATYSPRTLRLYAGHVKSLRARNQNMTLQIMEHTVRMYGYSSLEKAEAALRSAET